MSFDSSKVAINQLCCVVTCQSNKKRRVYTTILTAIYLAIVLLFSVRTEAFVADALQRPATKTQLGTHSVLLGADYADKRVVVVGERGLILLSDDQGNTWQQAESPVSVTLTAVKFFDGQVGYAVGHSGVVLKTENAGQHWSIETNGIDFANLLLDQAKRTHDEMAIATAQRFVDDGPDKPLLDLLLLGPKHLVVIGAYGLAFESRDGGQTWQSWFDRIGNPMGMHLYSIRKAGARILLSGEQGFIALSTDNGRTFQTLTSPYEGSFFTAQLIQQQGIVLAGLRGNAFVSHDNGVQWDQLAVPVPASISASTITPNGQLLFANQAGILLRLNDEKLVPVSSKPMPQLTNLLSQHDDRLLALSVRGPIALLLEGDQLEDDKFGDEK
nr:YCF48-related protein [uncultured Vibrio sp.]